MTDVIMYPPKQPDLTAIEAVKPSLLDIIDRASREKVDVSTLAELWRMNLEWEANEARKAFNESLTKFKQHPPLIPKNRHVHYETSKGPVDYWHTTLDKACSVIGGELQKYDITMHWETNVQPDGITVTCVLTHKLGHNEKTTLQGPPDSTGSKNTLQAVGSTVTYLQRYTLLAAVGLAAENTDNDGAGMGLSNDRIGELCEFMANSCSKEELNKMYAMAANEALDVADKRAIAIFKESKKKRMEDF